ncbi:endolytic transglycosylase MltG [Desulforhopalus singaporensis]|nr:endolytic transglycosylase MltG [Desulforhopalus singaporensis]
MVTDISPDHSKKNPNRTRRVAFYAILLVLFGAACPSGWFLLYSYRNGPEIKEQTVTVSIPKGTTVAGIREILADNKIIHDDIRFLVLAKFSGVATRLQAGEFSLPSGKKPGEILRILASARSIQYPVTIPEGLRADEIARIFSQGGWCRYQRFMELVDDQTLIANLGFTGVESLEGYLFPDTYLLTKDFQGADKLIRMMVANFENVWSGISASHPEIPERPAVVTLASIIEKETGEPSERSLISGVFHNRLNKGMRLQSDPTVIYGTGDFSGKITKTHLRTPSPYNTYTLPGLPKGPICNPGEAALKAAVEPTETDALYFVSKNDGTHYFSTTLDEHNRAVVKYQRQKQSKKGK